MDFITRALLENALLLAPALALAEVAAIIVWRIRRTRAALRAVAVPPLIAAAVFLLAWLVVTDREKIASAYRAMAADVSAGGSDVLAAHLDTEVQVNLYADPHTTVNKDNIPAIVHRYINAWRIRQVKLSQLAIEVSGDHADTKVTTTILNDAPDTAGAPVILRWSVMWIKRPDRWRIYRADLIEGGMAALTGP